MAASLIAEARLIAQLPVSETDLTCPLVEGVPVSQVNVLVKPVNPISRVSPSAGWLKIVIVPVAAVPLLLLTSACPVRLFSVVALDRCEARYRSDHAVELSASIFPSLLPTARVALAAELSELALPNRYQESSSAAADDLTYTPDPELCVPIMDTSPKKLTVWTLIALNYNPQRV
tara:strand:- start:84 stop:608 length:525 start_codon:yes stop_codon:yes gene_type:complete